MEIVHIVGYTHNEQRHILDKFLMPQAIKNEGILNSEVFFTITNEVKAYVIHNYYSEPGVRSLKKYFNKIAEKMAYQMVDNPEGVREIKVDIENIEKYIGHALYKSSKIYSLNPLSVSLD
jgi:ATP-dependent Lon protease